MVRELRESWLATEKAQGGRSALKGDVTELRAQFAALMEATKPLLPAPSGNVETKDSKVGNVPIRIYTPKNAKGPLPAGIYLHGGGWVLGGLDSEDRFIQTLAEHANVTFVSVDYRLAPEAKAPAQVEDAVEVAEWVAANASSYGGDPKKLFILGVSAGGGLTLSVGRKIVLGETKIDPKVLKGLAPFAPITLHPDNVPENFKSQYTAYKDNESNVPILDAAAMHSFFKETGVKPDDKVYLTALDQANFSKYPPSFFVTCEFDPLRDDGKVMAEGLKKAGVPVKVDHWDGLPHCFWMIPTLPDTQEFVGKTVASLEWLKSQW